MIFTYYQPSEVVVWGHISSPTSIVLSGCGELRDGLVPVRHGGGRLPHGQEGLHSITGGETHPPAPASPAQPGLHETAVEFWIQEEARRLVMVLCP